MLLHIRTNSLKMPLGIILCLISMFPADLQISISLESGDLVGNYNMAVEAIILTIVIVIGLIAIGTVPMEELTIRARSPTILLTGLPPVND